VAIGEKIRIVREEKKMTQKKIGELAGIDESTIRKYESGRLNPKLVTIQKIAAALDCSVDYLLGNIDDPRRIDYAGLLGNLGTVHKLGNVLNIPIYGIVKAGYGALLLEDFEGYAFLEETEISGDIQDYFWLRVSGDSMSPKIQDGDLVLVRKQNAIDSGQIAVVIYNGEDGTLKKIRFGPDYLELIPLNPAFESRIFERDEMEDVHIVGRVIKMQRDFRY